MTCVSRVMVGSTWEDQTTSSQGSQEAPATVRCLAEASLQFLSGSELSLLGTRIHVSFAYMGMSWDLMMVFLFPDLRLLYKGCPMTDGFLLREITFHEVLYAGCSGVTLGSLFSLLSQSKYHSRQFISTDTATTCVRCLPASMQVSVTDFHCPTLEVIESV